MVIEPEAIFAGVGGVVALAYGFEIGVAFLMRAPREAIGGGGGD